MEVLTLDICASFKYDTLSQRQLLTLSATSGRLASWSNPFFTPQTPMLFLSAFTSLFLGLQFPTSTGLNSLGLNVHTAWRCCQTRKQTTIQHPNPPKTNHYINNLQKRRKNKWLNWMMQDHTFGSGWLESFCKRSSCTWLSTIWVLAGNELLSLMGLGLVFLLVCQGK